MLDASRNPLIRLFVSLGCICCATVTIKRESDALSASAQGSSQRQFLRDLSSSTWTECAEDGRCFSIGARRFGLTSFLECNDDRLYNALSNTMNNPYAMPTAIFELWYTRLGSASELSRRYQSFQIYSWMCVETSSDLKRLIT